MTYRRNANESDEPKSQLLEKNLHDLCDITGMFLNVLRFGFTASHHINGELSQKIQIWLKG